MVCITIEFEFPGQHRSGNSPMAQYHHLPITSCLFRGSTWAGSTFFVQRLVEPRKVAPSLQSNAWRTEIDSGRCLLTIGLRVEEDASTVFGSSGPKFTHRNTLINVQRLK